MNLIKAIITAVLIGMALIWVVFGIIGFLITKLYPKDGTRPLQRRRRRAF